MNDILNIEKLVDITIKVISKGKIQDLNVIDDYSVSGKKIWKKIAEIYYNKDKTNIIDRYNLLKHWQKNVDDYKNLVVSYFNSKKPQKDSFLKNNLIVIKLSYQEWDILSNKYLSLCKYT